MANLKAKCSDAGTVKCFSCKDTGLRVIGKIWWKFIWEIVGTNVVFVSTELHPLFPRKCLWEYFATVIFSTMSAMLHPLFHRMCIWDRTISMAIQEEIRLHPLFHRMCLLNKLPFCSCGIRYIVASSDSAQLPLRHCSMDPNWLSNTSCILWFSANRSSIARIYTELGKNKTSTFLERSGCTMRKEHMGVLVKYRVGVITFSHFPFVPQNS